jgi:hypothetical protein
VTGAGYAPPWDTDIAFANAQKYPLNVWIGGYPVAPTVCAGSCPGTYAAVPPSGMAETSARLANALTGGAVETLFVVPLQGVDPPTTRARIVNRANPHQAADLPVVRLSTIAALNPTVLSFPSATRHPGVRNNLILTMLSEFGSATGVVEVFSRFGDRLGSLPFQINNNDREIFLYDILLRLGVTELDHGQIRVTKTGGNGLMWGLLATVYDDGRVSVSLGANP